MGDRMSDQMALLEETRTAPDSGGMPLVALAHNEANLIAPFLAHYRAMGPVHFVIVDDHSTDGTRDLLMAGLKAKPRPVKGRCGQCQYFDICGGNTRVRAQQLTGDPWAEDPACYLEDAEIGIGGGNERLTVTPYKRSITA